MVMSFKTTVLLFVKCGVSSGLALETMERGNEIRQPSGQDAGPAKALDYLEKESLGIKYRSAPWVSKMLKEPAKPSST